MKSYSQGLLTGVFFTLSLLLFMGQTTLDKQIKNQLKEIEKLENEIEILGKSMSKSFKDNETSNNSVIKGLGNSVENKIKNLDQKIDYIYKSIDKKIERIIISTNDNNGILQDIYTDGIPCDN